MGFPGGSVVKNLPVQETQVQSLGWEDPLEEERATHLSFLAWETPWTEEPGELWSMGLQRIGRNLPTEQQQVYICQSQSLNSSPPPFPHLVYHS